MNLEFTMRLPSRVIFGLALPFFGVGLGCVHPTAEAQQLGMENSKLSSPISSGSNQNAVLFPWKQGGSKVRISYTGGDEKPLDPSGRPALCDAFDLIYSKQTRVLFFEQCQGARQLLRRNVLLTAECAQEIENAVAELQLISSPRCPAVADAGILHVTIQNTAGELKNYVDSVTCGYGTSYNGVLEYETILNVLNITKGLVGK